MLETYLEFTNSLREKEKLILYANIQNTMEKFRTQGETPAIKTAFRKAIRPWIFLPDPEEEENNLVLESYPTNRMIEPQFLTKVKE